MPVAAETDQRFAALTAGAEHTCGLTDDGAVYCWGRNREGQLGDGSRKVRTTPTRLETNRPFFEIKAAGFHTCALAGKPGSTSSGPAFCWGANHYGQLGNGSFDSRTTPTEVAGSDNYETLHLADVRSCAAGPTLDCWGTAESKLTLAPASPFADKKMDRSIVDVARTPKEMFEVGEATAVVAGRHVACKATSSGITCRYSEAPNKPLTTSVDRTMTEMVIAGAQLCGVSGDGELWCSPRNAFAAGPPENVGLGAEFEFEPISALGYVDVDQKARRRCVVDEEGEVLCNGLNLRGAAGLSERGVLEDLTPVACQK